MVHLDYETGVGVSLALSGAQLVYALCRRTSVFHTNLAKIGVRQSFSTGEFRRGGSLLWEIAVSVVLDGLIALLSWVAVAGQVLSKGYEMWVRRFTTPSRTAMALLRLGERPLTEREAAERFVACAEAVSGCIATPSEREKAILWVLSHVCYTGTDDYALYLFDRTPEGELLAVGRDEIKKEIHDRQFIIINEKRLDGVVDHWVFDVVEMQAVYEELTRDWPNTPLPRLYDLRRRDAEHWEMREHLTQERVSVPSQHASRIEALFQRMLASGVPQIGFKTLATYVREEHEAAASKAAAKKTLPRSTDSEA
ncbi:hypothetical protein F0U62_33725 [Cystobacter fuscus]|uniref:hypothetical protein n=1 Tax=Cystobacter fuscus TaxID=43 RepID=UPI002B2B8254|nr:hypothetical protein F0U62_33725 [Cystobacter fuscus]